MDSNPIKWRSLVRTDSILLVVALAAGTVAAILSTRYLGASAAATEASLRNRYKATAVVVAAADLHAGDTLDATRLAVREMPREFLPDDAVPAERAGELLGGHAAIPMRRGTPVVAAALKQASGVQRLSSVLSGDRRALTIAVDQVNSQSGNVMPGDYVDLLYSHSSGADSLLIPLLQHVEVLATGASLADAGDARFPGAERSYSAITLGLSAEDAARVTLAEQSGNLSVVLRAQQDLSQIAADPRSSRDLLRRAAKARIAPVDARVEVLVGGNGGLLPQRSWLAVGQGGTAGDAT